MAKRGSANFSFKYASLVSAKRDCKQTLFIIRLAQNLKINPAPLKGVQESALKVIWQQTQKIIIDLLLNCLCNLARPQSPRWIRLWQGCANRKRLRNTDDNWPESRENDRLKYDTISMRRRHVQRQCAALRSACSFQSVFG